jgi:hypothetical protein
MTPLEIRALKRTVKGLITTFQKAERSGDDFTMEAANVQLTAIGNKLTKELVVGCDSLEQLVLKYPDHGYRPTLREPDALVLADIYDFRAKRLGINVTAYRG